MKDKKQKRYKYIIIKPIEMKALQRLSAKAHGDLVIEALIKRAVCDYNKV